MTDNRVKEEDVIDLLNNAEIESETVFGKCTVVTAKLENGFVLTASSGSVDPENYDQEMGEDICLSEIEKKLWELEGYALQKRLHEASLKEKPEKCGNFGWALENLKMGYKLRRKGWNGKGIYIALQRPTAKSKMTSPYIYIDTTGLQTENQEAPKSLVPWLASQTDMLAEDWVLA